MSLYAELHRHLGGSVVPRILWRYFQRNRPDIAAPFADYAAFESFYTRPRNTLAEYLELHTLVESVQTEEALDRKSTRLNSSHRCISYAVFCLKKKKNIKKKKKYTNTPI